MAIEHFKCPLPEIKTVEEWATGPNTKENCPPCLITPLAGYYLGTLEAAGEIEKAKELKAAFDTGEVREIAKTLDSIKSGVGEKLKEELLQYDCFAQVYKESEA